MRFAEVAAESDYVARLSWEAEWDRDPADDDDGLTEAVIPTTDGPALVDLMRMSEDEWDAYTRGSAIRRAGYAGLRRTVAVALGVLLGALEDEDAVVAACGLGVTASQASGRVIADRTWSVGGRLLRTTFRLARGSARCGGSSPRDIHLGLHPIEVIPLTGEHQVKTSVSNFGELAPVQSGTAAADLSMGIPGHLQEVCPYTYTVSRLSEEPDYAARGPHAYG